MAQTPRHIGIIGCSAEGAALCYRTICVEGAARLGGYRHPEVSLHTLPLSDYVDALEAGDLEAVAALMVRSATALERCGAEILICPDNTIHQALSHGPDMPRPFISIADAVVDYAEAAGFHKLGLLGTRWLVASTVYDDAAAAKGLSVVRPDDDLGAEVSRIIMDELVHGAFHEPAQQRVGDAVGALQRMGADAVVLACTELPILMDGAEAALPLMDSTRILARAALDRACT
ncbi:MAG: amino acid racemase [Pseudomonadota bacterium]